MKTFLFFFFFFFFFSVISAQKPRPNRTAELPWRPSENRTIVSANSLFAAGFIRIQKSPAMFRFSVWYLNVPNNSVVWYANKSPVSLSGGLSVTPAGDLHLGKASSSSNPNLWPGRASSPNNQTILILSDQGNLIFGDWESFDHPTDTFLPNQTTIDRELRSENGKFSFRNGTDLLFNSSDRYWSATTVSSGFVRLDGDGKVDLQNGKFLVTSDFGAAVKRIIKLDNDGNLRIYGFDDERKEWEVVWHATHELCTVHGTCGPNAICTGDGSGPTKCICPPEFSPAAGNYGCVADSPVGGGSRFVRLDYVNYTGEAEVLMAGKNLAECKRNCTARPDCLGFMIKYDGRGTCSVKLGRLLNGYWSPGTESVMFLRLGGNASKNLSVPTSGFKGMTEILDTTCPVRIELPLPPEDSDATARNVAIICTLFAAELISGALFFWAFLKKYIKYRDMARTLGLELLPAGGPKRFSYAELKVATSDFSEPIGRGGFGDVYRGVLPDRRVVAVKCLKSVAGGEPEFWAEVTIIARMHHLNLVRLWGFCAEKGARILVYEHVPNGSLEKFLFKSDQAGPNPLEWSVRYRIALGVARAMAYLHEECLEWVLHCDIKPENILLGSDFCPKISDFGLSKLRKKEDMVSLSKIRGTRGYMAPEWVKSDTITAKADVYSFGMVLLELVSGVRNTQAQGSEAVESENWYFPAWAFDKVYKEVSVEDILDSQIKQSYDSRAHFDMVNRMVKTAMWCLQGRPENRPSMGKVAKMLEGTVEITQPNKPTIFFLGDD